MLVERKQLSLNNLHTLRWAFLTHLNYSNMLRLNELHSTSHGCLAQLFITLTPCNIETHTRNDHFLCMCVWLIKMNIHFKAL